MFLHKLVQHPSINEFLGQFGEQLQANGIGNFRDEIRLSLFQQQHMTNFKFTYTSTRHLSMAMAFIICFGLLFWHVPLRSRSGQRARKPGLSPNNNEVHAASAFVCFRVK